MDRRYISFMLGRQERLAVLLLSAVLIVVIVSHLALGYFGKGPFAIPYSDQANEGDLVLVNGTIDALTLTRTGGHIVISVNNVTVFLPNSVASGLEIRKGVNVSIIGEVQTYEGKREVIVQAAPDIIILL